MDPVGRIMFTDDSPYQGRYRVVQIDCRPFSLGDIFTVVDTTGEHTVIISPVEGIHRCDGCMFKPNDFDTHRLNCSCCTENMWFPCVDIRQKMKYSKHFIFKPTSDLMEEL